MRILLFCALTFCLFVTGQTVFTQVEWAPVSQSDLDAVAPVVEPDADAEAIFWEVRLDNEKRTKLFYNHYVRVKIFTERGRERFAKIDIPFTKGKKVEDVAARVIKRDGSIVNLSSTDIFERDIIRAGKTLIRAKSFAVPGIEPGVIVEYQYKETFKGDTADNERLIFQRDIPIRRVTYFVRPYKGMTMSARWRNMSAVRFVDAGDGFMSTTVENVPALREEPQMPPDDEVRRWALIKYTGAFFNWRWVGNAFGLLFAEATKVDGDIQSKANELTAGLSDDDRKLEAIYTFAQSKIRNVSYDRSMTEEQREKIKNKKATDTLKRGMGHSDEIDLLFAALAKAAGFQVDLILAGDRSESFLDPKTADNPRAVHWTGISVTGKHGSVLCSPGAPFMPYGIVDWYEEGVGALMANERVYRWTVTNISPPNRNLSTRTAKLKLLEDGTLEGTVRIQHLGHEATSRRRGQFERSPAEREDAIRKIVLANLGSGEITSVAIEDFEDSTKPYTYSYNVRIPNYAQKTGKRLFLQPNFFQFGKSPLFASSERRYSIYFEFPWSEEDTVEIELPKNYEPDSIAEPNEINEKSDLGNLKNKYDFNPETGIFKAERHFYFGTSGRLIFPVSAYKPLKTLFDLFHSADSHSIALKQKQ